MTACELFVHHATQKTMEYCYNFDKDKESEWAVELTKEKIEEYRLGKLSKSIKSKSKKTKKTKKSKNKLTKDTKELIDTNAEYEWQKDLTTDRTKNQDEIPTTTKCFGRWNFTGRCFEKGLNMLPPGVSKC